MLLIKLSIKQCFPAQSRLVARQKPIDTKTSNFDSLSRKKRNVMRTARTLLRILQVVKPVGQQRRARCPLKSVIRIKTVTMCRRIKKATQRSNKMNR